MANIIILDSGHAFNTPGKRNEKERFYEFDFNNKMQYLIAQMLKSYNVSVYMTNPYPHTVKDISLSERVNIANKYYNKNDNILFISLHANAYSDENARGTETYHATVCSDKSKQFAKIVNDNVFNVFKKFDSSAKNRGVKSANFTVIKNTKMPGVLIEFGFYTNLKDLNILRNKQTELADAVVKSICSYFNFNYKGILNVSEELVEKKYLYRVCVGSYSVKENAIKLQSDLKKLGYDSFIIIEEK